MRLPCNTTVTLADAWGLSEKSKVAARTEKAAPRKRSDDVPVHRRNTPWNQERDEIACRMWLRGESLIFIASELGVSPSTVSKRMSHLGMPRRVESREQWQRDQEAILTKAAQRVGA